MAVVTRSPNKDAAQAFIDKVLSKQGQATMLEYGFLPITAPVPTLSTFAPAKGTSGTSVTVTGTNFKGTTSVTFQGVPGKFAVKSPTKIVVVVPPKAKTGKITVTNPSGTVISTKAFSVA
jgi:hypothetical protein